jgi:hypothetical protein
MAGSTETPIRRPKRCGPSLNVPNIISAWVSNLRRKAEYSITFFKVSMPTRVAILIIIIIPLKVTEWRPSLLSDKVVTNFIK